MSGAPFAWTFDQRFAPDAGQPGEGPNVAVTRQAGAAAAVTYASGTTEALTREAGETDAEDA